MSDTYQRPPLNLFLAGRDLMLGSVPGTGRLLTLSRGAGSLAMGCVGFDSLENHAQQLCAQLKLPPDEHPTILLALRELAAKGLLSSRSHLLRGLRSQPATSNRLTLSSVGMVTRNRPQAAWRCARSFADHFRAHGRRVDITVVDSSDHEDALTLQAALGGLSARGTVVRCLGMPEKTRLAEELAKRAEVDPALTRFAVLGDQLSSYDVGANRNALLLALAGQPFLSTDDDMECAPRQAPDVTNGLRLSSAESPTELTLFPDYQQACDSLVPIAGSVLDLHERVLGRSPASCLQDVADDQIELGALSAAMITTLLRDRGQVRVSFGGYYGDVGANFPSFYLWSDAIRRQLVGGAERYQQLVTSRQVVRLAPALTVSSSCFSMCGSVALDSRQLLPPFFPVMRGEDLAFGSVLRSCFKDALFAYVPQAVAHRPCDDRRGSLDRLWNPASRAQMPFILGQLLEVADDASRFSAPGERRLRLTGRNLCELAALSSSDFSELLGERVVCARAKGNAALEQLLEYSKDTPKHWADALRGFMKHQIDSLASPQRAIPHELSDRDPVEATRALQGLVGRYGALLEVWPEIFAAAQRLANERPPHLT